MGILGPDQTRRFWKIAPSVAEVFCVLQALVSPARHEAPWITESLPNAPWSLLPKLFQVSTGLCRALLPPDVQSVLHNEYTIIPYC